MVREQSLLRVAIIGDPHFVSESHGLAGRSSLKFNEREQLVFQDTLQNPWSSLDALIERELKGQRIDLLLCAGDLSSGGEQSALRTGWRHLNELAQRLGVVAMACATGNHDVRSRSAASIVQANAVRNLAQSRGVNEHLRLLDPPFPIVPTSSTSGWDARSLRTRYFGDYFAMIEATNFRLIVLDSCNEHGTDNHDYEKGAFPPSAQRDLRQLLASSSAPKLNLLLCHHPPVPHASPGDTPFDFITGGEQLIEILEEHGAWLIIHGHKHQGRITRATGGGQSPIVFAAASLAYRGDTAENGYRNQFYVVDVHDDHGDIKGTVRAWDWYSAMGYVSASPSRGGIFDSCGFGCHASPAQLAASIAAAATQLPMSWENARAAVPELLYLMPRDYSHLEKCLLRSQIIVDKDPQQTWRQLAKAV